jgi:anti-sigma factor RsiW
MSCDFSEKVSLLIDRELSPSQAEQMRKHLTECQECQQVEQNFLELRRQIRSYEFDPDPVAQRQTLWRVMASRNVPLWRRPVTLPAPIFGVVVVALLILGAWYGFVRTTTRQSPQPGQRVNIIPLEGYPEAGAIDLSRFDTGKRALVYKQRRDELNESGGNGANR